MTNPVQEWSGYAYGSSATATAGTLPTTGHGVVIVIGMRNNNSVTSVTDNQAGSPNTYTLAVSSGYLPDVDIWYCNSLTINQSSFVLTVTPNTTTGIQIFAAEIIGLNGVDKTNSSIGSSVTTLSVTNGSANTNANDIVIAGFTTGSLSGGTIGLTGPASTGYTNIGNYDYANNQSSNGSYKLVSAIETSSATFSWTTAAPFVTAAIASFKVIGTPNTALDTIKTGTTPGDATGDPARVGGTKINDALISIYSARGARATTPGCFGVSSSAGTTTTLIDATQTWATNQFAGQYVTVTTGTLPSSGTATSNIAYSSLIASNTATTLTFAALPFATTSGCGYDISPVVTTAQTDGQATSVGGTAPSTLVDASKSWTTNQWAGYMVTFLGGAYAGQQAPIASNTSGALTLSTAFASAIAAGTPYVIGSGQIAASQYVTSGSTITVNPGTLWLELNGPTTMTVTFPSSPYDTQRLEISTTTAITSFATAGGTVSGAPSTMSANTGIAFRYHLGTTTWYRVQ